MRRYCLLACFWIVLFLFLLRHPTAAATTVNAIFDGLTLIADALAAFASAL
ncbi:hypothetical protein SMC26_24200 [Actinomadura fulvescens]|uniref:Uncharacterized protein n=1 Tax=Actinomadura fulvescens TaxID=46160 RepID=A0ABN3Q532_9ACTN